MTTPTESNATEPMMPSPTVLVSAEAKEKPATASSAFQAESGFGSQQLLRHTTH
jgi:hypothetical protein